MWWDEEVKRAVGENKKMRRWLKGRTEQKRAEYVITRNRAEIVKREATKKKKRVMEGRKEELG